jgi:hypothetical protein
MQIISINEPNSKAMIIALGNESAIAVLLKRSNVVD